eukprot:TRINITY_DN2324_c0_g1_i2.p1 TRINITY_DN2324_c0_g1~~TRINITY_DN2324_c0_g1_i2.p1  ORF type:complete len:1145 (+),score=548.34 TRINITY_DN2324_c0_g1_i2:58-3435(+)
MSDDEYQFDSFDDGSSRLVGEQQNEKMHTFLAEYGQQLRDLEETLHESLSDAWDADMDPVSLDARPYEQTNVLELLNTENKVFNKVILVFAALCKEAESLCDIAKDKFYGPFLCFGQDGKGQEEGDSQLRIGEMLPFLMDMLNYVNRVYSVIKNMVQQLASLYHAQQQLYVKSFKGVHLNTVFHQLSELLTVLITLDEIIAQNAEFKLAWSMYKRMAHTVKGDAERYATDEARMLQFEKLLLQLEGQLLDGLIYQNAISQEFDFPGVIEARRNDVFNKEFMLNIKAIWSRMTAKSGDLNEIYQRRSFIGLCALYVFYFILFNQPSDKKFFKQVWDMHKVIPVIHLAGNVVWFSSDFLRKKVPYMVKAAVGQQATVKEFQKNYVKELDKTFERECAAMYKQLTTWMVRMESNLTNRANMRNILNTRISLLITGLKMACTIGDMFKQYVYMHSYLQMKIKPARIRALCQCAEMLKAIQSTFHRRSAMIGESIAYMIQQISFYLQRAFFPIKVKLQSTTSYSEQRLDLLAAANLAMQMLNGCATPARRLLLRLSMHILFQMSNIKDDQIEDIKNQVRRLDLICSLQRSVDEACDCSFFYWSRPMVPYYFRDVFENPQQAQKLHYMFAALRDVVPLFKTTYMEEALTESYKKDVDGALQDNIITPLCDAIETDLRYHIHSHLEVSVRDPFKNGVQDLAALINIKPLRFFDRTIDLKAHIEHYLDKTFYNLTTVALYDWKTYAEMRNLAQEKFGLTLQEVHLPGQTLEQGVDVLEIMRNIHIFTAVYNYNLNNQIFIQRSSESKFLNTVNIGHISNSLRSHGGGIMNTAVNFTYQFLRRKFVIFSQFLYDDHIKSRLYKDIRFFRESKDELDSRYPFDRAVKFNREIRKLGVTGEGLTYLDQFRKLITEIGNAMGYIRMIRSGGLFFTSNSSKFVPDLAKIPKFSELATNASLAPETIEACTNLDAVLDNLSKNFAEGTDYFKMLVAVFAPQFRNEQNLHLKNFYIIVPAATLNFVEHMLICKDKMKNKKGQQFTEGVFSDDGFAIGLAYILKLLDQNTNFDSLHWFEAVTNRYAEEEEKLRDKLGNAKKGVKVEETQTALLTMKKLAAYRQEFELLRFSFSGARIFFKD